MKSMIVIVVVMATCTLYTKAAPSFFDTSDFDFHIPDFKDLGMDCAKLGCATGTSSCSKKTSTTPDKKYIEHVIKCFNAEGGLSDEKSTQEVNPNPESTQNGYEFYGSYSSGGSGQSITVTNGGTNVHTHTSTVNGKPGSGLEDFN